MKTQTKSARKRELTPPLKIAASDFDKLLRLSQASSRSPDVAEYLARELDRAHVVPTESIADDVVRIGSAVRFRDENTAREHDVVLVYPPEADIERQRISVLTPIGAALIGLSPGQTITFHSRDGMARDLTVLHVTAPQPL